MRIHWSIVLALAACVGCTSDGRYTWDDALKDARGDNMQMRSGWGKSQTEPGQTSSTDSNK